jgi:hypothetical protein
MDNIGIHPGRAIFKATVHSNGVPVTLDAVRVNGQTFLIRGKYLKTAELKEMWAEDVANPAEVIHQLRHMPIKPDIFRFWQRIPETTPKYPYYRELIDVAAIPITTHKQWFEKQISRSARNKIRKAFKHGVEFHEELLSDRLIRGITALYNDSPVRRGKPFWHYGKDFEMVKKQVSEDLDVCRFVTAYSEGELIGFIKLLFFDRCARTAGILDKLSCREKSPMNGMISKAVEICATNNIPYLVYSTWRRGDHGQFQASTGFIKTPLPEYFVPLTAKGRMALTLHLHKGLKSRIPERTMIRLLQLRAIWYARKFGTKSFRVVH